MQFLSSNHLCYFALVSRACTQVLAFIELYPWIMYNSQGFNVKFLMQCTILSETCCGQNAEAAAGKQSHFSTHKHFFKALSHIADLHVQHTKLLLSRPASVVCVCANFNILAGIVLAVASIYKIL
jgi:hypothetical protein